MITKKEKNQIILIMYLLTGSALISIALRWVIPYLLNSFSIEVTMVCHNMINLFESAIWGFAMIYAVLNRRLFNNVVGIIAALVLTTMQMYYIVTSFISICCGTNSAFNLGVFGSITICVISVVSQILFYVSLRQWLPAKITSILMPLPGFAYVMIYWLFLYNSYDYQMSSIVGGITSTFTVIFYLATLVLTVVWNFLPEKKVTD